VVGFHKVVVEKVFPTFTIKSLMAGSHEKRTAYSQQENGN
jgi:hypothetical protein